MRSVFTAFMIFFITASCFAIKPERSSPAFSFVKEKKASLSSRFLHQSPLSENDSLSKDEFDQPKCSRQFIKKQVISCIQLFHPAEKKSHRLAVVGPYLANADHNANFIYLFLYLKHVFW